MEAEQLTFTLDGISYRIDPHIWDDYPNRIGLVTVERIRETIRTPDVKEEETTITTLYWKWFPEIGRRGNYIKVVVKIDDEIRFVITSYPDSSMRSKMGTT